MKNIIILVFLFSFLTGKSQVEYKMISSTILEAEREVKIQLPRNYKKNTHKSYPVFVVLDGDYLFEPVAGNVDYYSYWGEMPEAIVVGVNQISTRKADTKLDKENFFPSKSGADFFEFLGMELLPLIDQTYRTVPFSIIVGHNITANLMNYYLLKPKPLFKAYINLSPDYAPGMQDQVYNALADTEQKTWYYLATAAGDIETLREQNQAMNAKLKKIDNPLLHYYFNDFEEGTHYSLVGEAIPLALKNFFSIYKPIGEKEYKKLIDKKEDYIDFLTEKYESIEELYELDINIRTEDFMTIAKAIEEKEKFEQYNDLAKLAEEHHPKTMLANYFYGRFYEEIGRLRRAIKEYEKAYAKESVSYITVDLVLDKSEELKIKRDQ